MKMLIKMIAVSLTALLPTYAFSADTNYSFDTVTAIDLHSSNPSITGIEKDTGTPLTVEFIDVTNISFRYIVNRCVPVFLTVMEKPGKYYLHLIVDPDASAVGLKSCKIELKS